MATKMKFKELDSVVLKQDLPEHALCKGDLGAVVLVLSPTLFEVEFVRLSGAPQALVQVPATAIRLVADEDVPAVRSTATR